MKKRLTLLLMITMMILPLFASEFQKLKDIEASGVQNADLFYNLGVTHWQLGESGISALYFLKALNIDSAHIGAKANLNYVIGLSKDREVYPKQGFLLKLAYQSYDYLTLDRLAIFSLILFLILALSTAWLLFYDENKERALPELITGIIFVIFLSFAILSAVKYYRFTHNKKAVLIAESANLLSKPYLDSRRQGVIHEACIVVVERREGGWTLVRSPDGKSGWVSTSLLGFVSEDAPESPK